MMLTGICILIVIETVYYQVEKEQVEGISGLMLAKEPLRGEKFIKSRNCSRGSSFCFILMKERGDTTTGQSGNGLNMQNNNG